ncbi:hypothetical protein GHU05_07245 [Fructobacillus tropaeoli]|uniref:hypothetical protein n=1 Tax=Fructobacillus tropaeoli TaxID=709323 RepID=UPI001455DCA9|nr:hypothetical protein [Fructobacillus tropaeoli]NLS38715.1 hypothetical protein [Fructobacillus tropaeoli]
MKNRKIMWLLALASFIAFVGNLWLDQLFFKIMFYIVATPLFLQLGWPVAEKTSGYFKKNQR